MPAASASGVDSSTNGETKHRDHNQGNQDKKYTIEQKTAVIRVRKCSATAFYEILGLETSASDGEIKKAYRKLSLLTHPDKNSYDGADEAFKMVSRAFQVLSDAEKKERFDRYGGDPDSRFGAGSASAASPFSGFARSPGAGGAMFDEGLTPEDIFRNFFGAEMGGLGGGMFGGGPQFVFMGPGGPRVRVHQFGGAGPRRRPREANGQQDENTPQSLLSTLSNLLPLIILFILPLLSSFFSSSMPTGPSVQFHPNPPNTLHRTSHRLKVDYFVDPADVVDYGRSKFKELDRKAETQYITNLQYECQLEHRTRDRMFEDAQGWFTHDERKMAEARSYDMRACKRLQTFGYSTRY